MKIQFWVIMAIYLLSFAAALVLKDVPGGEKAAALWPKYHLLESYCAQNNCVYDARFVSLTYLLHTLIAVGYMTFVLVSLAIKGGLFNKSSVPMVLLAAVLLYILFRLIMVEFSFETDTYSLFENSVASSYIGLLRAFWIGICLSLLMLAFRAGRDKNSG